MPLLDDRQTYDLAGTVINATSVAHGCFGCGSANPQGLYLEFRALPDGGVWSAFVPQIVHEGYAGMVHGGITSTLLDEAMSWAVTQQGDLGVTTRLNVTFRAPLRAGHTVLLHGHVSNATRRTITTSAEVRDEATGKLLASATGEFMRVSAEQAARWRESYGLNDESVFAAAIGARANGGA